MDDEDIADAEEARKLQTTQSFSALGSTAEDESQQKSIMDILKTTGDTMGVKLLRKMGWRDGQGVGPRVRRRARLGEEDNSIDGGGQETHLFAPENSPMISFVKKNDRKGLGFEGEGHLMENLNGEWPKGISTADEVEELDSGVLAKSAKSKKKRPEGRGGFGVGILNDNGSDDEDPYHMGPQISYNRIIGGDKKKKKPENGKTTANPLLSSKPVFMSKKKTLKNSKSTFRRCHDGRLPLTGFVLSTSLDPLSSILSQDGKYPPPTIPQGWKSSKTPTNCSLSSVSQSNYQSPATVAKASTLSPKSRAALLGETALPGKSVFDFLSPSARSRIASATKNPNLPPALSEAPTNPSTSAKSLQSLVPPLSPTTALTALSRGAAGWMPYAEDPPKRARYRSFLEIRASLHPDSSTALPERALGASNDEWVKEMNEFAHAAQIFKPMTGLMATRFTSSSSAPQKASDAPESSSTSTDQPELLSKPAEKPKDPALEAARLGMYGPLTRSQAIFAPTRLLCKRFNVKPPDHVAMDPADAMSSASAAAGAQVNATSSALPQRTLELVGKKEIDEMVRERGMAMGIGANAKREEGDGADGEDAAADRMVVDPERNEALEKERPEDAVFRAVFGSDSEDE